MYQMQYFILYDKIKFARIERQSEKIIGLRNSIPKNYRACDTSFHCTDGIYI